MKVSVTTDIKEGAPLKGENPLPIFRDQQPHGAPLKMHESMQPHHRKWVGIDCGKRILPYRMQDRYDRNRKTMSIKAIVLENECLRATFYPNYGGRLTSLWDKTNNKELVYNNPVIQPGNLAIRNAWLATGIEFNCSQVGHHFFTCSPIHAALVKDEHGCEFLRMYEFERCKQVYYQMDFHLPPKSPFLYVYVKIINPNDTSVSTYWWTNIDLPERDDVRVFSATDEVIYYMSPSQLEAYPGYSNMAVGRLPNLDSLPNTDLSYPQNFTFATDYFFQIDKSEPMPWEAAAYRDGFVMFEASTPALSHHKMFCWGQSIGGQKWKDYLSRPNEGNFFEIQAGLAPTQQHGYLLDRQSSVDFTQLFGSLYADRGSLHTDDWHACRSKLDQMVRNRIGPHSPDQMHELFASRAELVPERVLNHGSGFGAIEKKRRQVDGEALPPGAMPFPDCAIGADVLPWLSLLEHGLLPKNDETQAPGSYMTAPGWAERLDRALCEPKNRHWSAYYHRGIMHAEQFEDEQALCCFERSNALEPNVWALYATAALHQRHKRLDLAKQAYERLFAMKTAFSDPAFAQEFLSFIMDQSDYEFAWEFFERLPTHLQKDDRIALKAGLAAVETGHEAYARSLLEKEPSIIREGETSTTEIWYRLRARESARQAGKPYSASWLAYAKSKFQPPASIDFRMFASIEKKQKITEEESQ